MYHLCFPPARQKAWKIKNGSGLLHQTLKFFKNDNPLSIDKIKQI